MGGRKKRVCIDDHSKKEKTVKSLWRPIATNASSCEESSITPATVESEHGGGVQVGCSTSSTISNEHLMQGNVENKVGASLFRFIKGKGVQGGYTQKVKEEQTKFKIIFPSSKEDEFITIEGISIDSVTSASEKIQAIIDGTVRSRNLNYSHFISLPLAIHPKLVSKLINFQHTILGNDDSCIDENLDTHSNEAEDTTDNNKEVDQLSKENADVAVEHKVDDDSKSVKVNLTSIPFVSYAPKASKPSTSSDLGIDKSIFIKPKTFHLTVLMLKLWNTDRVKTATEVLQSISSKVMEALDNRPLLVRLKGLECMKGSLAKACVLYTPVEEIGNEARLLRAYRIHI
ncbi:hypothetical protein P8452_77709 [Trifolium repens]|nr:hypothetical protein P8452_77709 [Trifolium repens]